MMKIDYPAGNSPDTTTSAPSTSSSGDGAPYQRTAFTTPNRYGARIGCIAYGISIAISTIGFLALNLVLGKNGFEEGWFVIYFYTFFFPSSIAGFLLADIFDSAIVTVFFMVLAVVCNVALAALVGSGMGKLANRLFPNSPKTRIALISLIPMIPALLVLGIIAQILFATLLLALIGR